MNITNSRGLHLNPTSPCPIPTSPCPIPTSPSSLPSTTHKPLPRSHNAKRKPSSWADQTDECKYNKTNKKQRLAQIMHWTPTQKPKPHPTPSPKPNTTKQYEHKDGDKLGNSVLVALGDEKRVDSVNMEDEGSVNITNNYNMNLPDACDAQPRDAQSCDTQPCDAQSCDSHSCDSHSTLSSDLMSCDTLSSCDSNFGEHDGEKDGEQKRKKKKKTKKSSKKKRCSTAEEGKKVFVGGIKFEDCDAMLSNQNETLETLRHQKFTHIFYLFGAVMRIQGHWNNGYPLLFLSLFFFLLSILSFPPPYYFFDLWRYCFVVFATKRAARLAIRCLSYAPVRKRIVQNLQDGVVSSIHSLSSPLPSFLSFFITHIYYYLTS